MNKRVAWLVVPLMLSCGVESNAVNETTTVDSQEEPLQGGNVMTASAVSRTGIFQEWKTDDSTCTATVLYTSAYYRKTWLITAAHCLCDTSGDISIAKPLQSFTNFLVGGTQYYNSSYTCPGEDGPKSPHDIALISFDTGIQIIANDGSIMREYFRPVLSADPTISTPAPFAVFGAGVVNEYLLDGVCGTRDQSALDNDNSLRWAYGNFDNTPYGNVGTISGLDPGHSIINGGDSGGPWMVASSISEDNLIDNGVVAGVTSFSSCGLDWFGYEAASTFDSNNMSFLSSTMQGALVTTASPSWTRTCWQDWCHYSETQKASLLVSLL